MPNLIKIGTTFSSESLTDSFFEFIILLWIEYVTRAKYNMIYNRLID